MYFKIKFDERVTNTFRGDFDTLEEALVRATIEQSLVYERKITSVEVDLGKLVDMSMEFFVSIPMHDIRKVIDNIIDALQLATKLEEKS